MRTISKNVAWNRRGRSRKRLQFAKVTLLFQVESYHITAIEFSEAVAVAVTCILFKAFIFVEFLSESNNI